MPRCSPKSCSSSYVAEAAVRVHRVGAQLPLLVRVAVALRDVQHAVVEREQQPVGPGRVEGHAGRRPAPVGLRVEAVDRVVVELLVRAVLAPGPARALVERVGEPDPALRVDGQVVGDVQSLSFEPVRQHSSRAVRLVSDDPPRAALAGEQRPVGVEHEAVGAVGAVTVQRRRPGFGIVPPYAVAADVGEQQPAAVPRRTLRRVAVRAVYLLELPAQRVSSRRRRTRRGWQSGEWPGLIVSRVPGVSRRRVSG